MTTDWKSLCAELVEKVGFITWGSGTPEDLKELLNRARAALAESVGEWASMPAAINFMPEAQRRWYVLGWRAAIARWGNPAPPHDPWKEVLLDALVCNFLLEKEHENNPKKALNDLIAWEKQLATDPLINPAPLPEQEATND